MERFFFYFEKQQISGLCIYAVELRKGALTNLG